MKVTFYSAVDNLSLFERVGFYRDDISALKCIGGDLLLTNSVPKGILSFPDLLVAYFYSKSIIIAIACRLTGAKVVLTGGADQISPLLASGWRLRLHKGLAFIGLLAANRILLSCTDDMQNFRKLCFGLTFLQEKLVLANHVVIRATEPQKIGVVHHARFQAFTLCWMGAEGNVRRKGVDRAVKLIYLLRRLGVDATLDIAGTDGPGRNFIESIIDEFDLGKYVQVIGAISEADKNRRFSSGGVYLQLSEHEGFGVAAAEAFFSGMVVIHSNRGGLADVIGVHGLIVQLTSIDFEDMSAVSDLYNSYLNYTVDVDYLAREIEKYSLSARAAAFAKGIL